MARQDKEEPNSHAKKRQTPTPKETPSAKMAKTSKEKEEVVIPEDDVILEEDEEDGDEDEEEDGNAADDVLKQLEEEEAKAKAAAGSKAEECRLPGEGSSPTHLSQGCHGCGRALWTATFCHRCCPCHPCW